jgi:hypothetical protein
LQTHRWAKIRKQFNFHGGEGTKHAHSTKHQGQRKGTLHVIAPKCY